MITDTIDGVIIDTDEHGFELILSGHAAEYRFRIHGVALELMRAVDREIRPWWQEATLAIVDDEDRHEDLDAYELTDPKHPTYHERMSG